MPERLTVHLPTDCVVRDSVALPGAAGSLTTLALNEADLQVSCSEPAPLPRENVATVPLTRLAERTDLALTALPPTLAIVSTSAWPVVAAPAATGAVSSATDAAVIAR